MVILTGDADHLYNSFYKTIQVNFSPNFRSVNSRKLIMSVTNLEIEKVLTSNHVREAHACSINPTFYNKNRNVIFLDFCTMHFIVIDK